ncbi:OsmC family protein [Microbacterium dauci]|uniref:OsmC family protein n=1 Tax=Microbacterium dauci TaxID=3048008 RepID=A0ABT6ZGI4_9MICO|nr:OsmC family protein [Microbacterium sp. LX3-4]MDJ1115272.1 OsmC family protein [Microbacterium sp. LX3-4]
MTTRYRTSARNDDGGTGVSHVDGGLEVAVSSPLDPAADLTRSNPEQLLALSWATCLNATAQAIVRGAHRTTVRVEVSLQDAETRGGFEFVATAFVSGEGLDAAAADALAVAAHQRCPVSRLLEKADTVAVRSEPFAA